MYLYLDGMLGIFDDLVAQLGNKGKTLLQLRGHCGCGVVDDQHNGLVVER